MTAIESKKKKNQLQSENLKSFRKSKNIECDLIKYTSKDFLLPRGGGFPVKSVNLEEKVILSDATTPL